jgi:hypothetical protein
MALYRFENSLLCVVPCGTFSNSWHFSFPLKILIRQAYWRQLNESREVSPIKLFMIIFYLLFVCCQGYDLHNSTLAVLATAFNIVDEPLIRLRRFALLPLIR